nr:hypothetical protein P5631_18090 [Bacillus subtilis]
MPPSKEELKALYEKSGLDLKKFFNTSGMKYRELNLKEKLYHMSEDEQLEYAGFRWHADQTPAYNRRRKSDCRI